MKKSVFIASLVISSATAILYVYMCMNGIGVLSILASIAFLLANIAVCIMWLLLDMKDPAIKSKEHLGLWNAILSIMSSFAIFGTVHSSMNTRVFLFAFAVSWIFAMVLFYAFTKPFSIKE